jgi:uncharacterized membrane protein YeaQ/YmgE (transglycosylase-associated protein family)
MPYIVWIALIGMVNGWLAREMTNASAFGLVGI